MPQLDKLVFLSQLFWLFLTFSILYLFILKYILPVVASALKLRKKQISINKAETTAFANQKDAITAGYENVVQKILNNSREALNETVVSSNTWSSNVLKNINETLFVDANKEFLKASVNIIGKNFLIKNLIKSQ